MGHKGTAEHVDGDTQGDKAVYMQPASAVPELHIHAKTWIALAAINLVSFSQMLVLIGAGFLAQSMTLLVGDQTKATWCSTILTIFMLAFNPLLSQAADYWGRKYILIVNMILGFIGHIIISRAMSMATLLAGFCFAAFAFGPTFAWYAVVSEIVPRRYRAWSQASINISIGIGAIVGVLMGGALIRHGNLENYRIYWYVTAALSLLGTVGIWIGYTPPRKDLEEMMTTRQKLASLDWIGIALISTGLVLFALALSWANNPYAWVSAAVLVPLILGVILMLSFLLYEWLARKDGLLHHEMFRDRNFILSIIVVIAEGAAFFTLNNYLVFEQIVLFGTDSWNASLRYVVQCAATIFFCGIAGAYTTRTKRLKEPLCLALASYIVFNALMATVKPTTKPNSIWGYALLEGFSNGLILVNVFLAAQVATPRDMISVTTGLLTAARGLGAAIGNGINGVVLNNSLKKNLAPKIAQAVIPLGLPTNEIPIFIGDLAAGNVADLMKIPGIIPEIIAAGIQAFSEAYALALKNTWICAASFCAAAFIASLFMRNPKDQFNAHIDASVEVELARQQKEIDISEANVKVQQVEISKPE